MLKIIEHNNIVKVVHDDSVLPSSIPVVNKRQALRALDRVQELTKFSADSPEVTHLLETIRKFVMTR